MSVLAIRRTVQINSRPTEIGLYFGSKVAICVGDEFDWYESNYVQELRVGLGVTVRFRVRSWATQPGGVGDNFPPLLGPAGYRGYSGGGPMKMIFASTADSLYSVLYK